MLLQCGKLYLKKIFWIRIQIFFQNGGDSLKAIRLVNALKEELGIEPKISWLFEAPTISEFAARIQQEMDSNNYMEDDGEI